VFGIQAKVRAYQGPGYDGTLLREASDLADQTLRQFRNKPSAELGRLEKVRRDITANLAARDMEMAQFYEKKEFVDAARYYYTQVAQNYPQTPIAGAANSRLAALQGKPGTPPQRFTWVSAVFPEEKKPTRLTLNAPPANGGTIQR
jgi:outer membrane protein assembly factor BamD (BamD/ComL family)